jgi:hypothetical protein
MEGLISEPAIKQDGYRGGDAFCSALFRKVFCSLSTFGLASATKKELNPAHGLP